MSSSSVVLKPFLAISRVASWLLRIQLTFTGLFLLLLLGVLYAHIQSSIPELTQLWQGTLQESSLNLYKYGLVALALFLGCLWAIRIHQIMETLNLLSWVRAEDGLQTHLSTYKVMLQNLALTTGSMKDAVHTHVSQLTTVAQAEQGAVKKVFAISNALKPLRQDAEAFGEDAIELKEKIFVLCDIPGLLLPPVILISATTLTSILLVAL